MRNRTDAAGEADGLPVGEGAVLACSFWLTDTYVPASRLSEAAGLFERLLELANDLGLSAEEYDARRGTLMGNFPQALTHFSVVHTARLINDGVAPRYARRSLVRTAPAPSGRRTPTMPPRAPYDCSGGHQTPPCLTDLCRLGGRHVSIETVNVVE